MTGDQRAEGVDPTEALQARLLSLITGPFGSFTLSFNDENGYQTVEQRLKTEPRDRLPEWISDAERDKAIVTNSMWTLHWYPAGEVSFYCIAAASLSALLDAAQKLTPKR
jgi:hypothetical protein